MNYRRLTEDEILRLKSQSCLADDWGKVTVAEEFSTEFVHHTRFSGEVRLGVFHSEFMLPGGIRKHSGLRHVTLHNVTVGDNCCIENIQNYIANYEIGHDTFIENVDIILVDGVSKFGNGVEVSVLNETGGREVLINDKLSAHQAYILALYRHRPELIARMKEITDFYSNKHASAVGSIGNHVMILNTGSIKNVRIGDYCRICGTCRLYNGSINSNEVAPVHIGHGVICDDFIISTGSHVDDGAMLSRCFVGQACKLGHNYSASDSLFFSNCQGENGEACAIFAGPYTVTHHKSTLLIAGMFSFMNAGSGSNQSNHMYKLGPIHQVIARMKEITDFYSNKHASAVGSIGNHVMILNTGSIKNVRIGDYCRICGTCRLYNGSINSNEVAPVHIGHGVICDDFIISTGSHVDDGAMLSRCFVGQACKLGHNYSASDSLFFSNCQGENGEACAIFAGPYTVTHHKSTLLIAGMFSFMNAGSGSNQSNHMYKLGPIHQGTLERGAKTTSDSYILWPARVGAFSLVMGRHVNHSDTSNLPFSYLIEQNNTTYLVPGVNLRSVGTIRDAQKWPKRDGRTDPNKLDYINYNLLSPYTVQKMFKGRETLQNLRHASGELSDIYSFHSAKIRNSALVKGIRFYEIAIHKFLGNSVIKRLEGIDFRSNEEIRARLKPDTAIGSGEWVDISGLIAPKSEIDALIDGIESGKVNRLKSINAEFEKMHSNYYTYEWTWAYEKLEEFYGIKPEGMTAEDVIHIVEKWKEAVVGLDRMVYEDAKKEFSLASMTGFGADGSRLEKELDFEQVRGDFESNPFVMAVLKHIEVKTALGDELIGRMQRVSEN